jgi:hypothetical protein
LPEPEVLAAEIVDDLEAALGQFKAVEDDLRLRGPMQVPVQLLRV